MKKLMNKKGFTLIEMLVVIAIIAVLVAIIIPTVSSATNKAAAATNAANLRSIVAEATTDYLAGTNESAGYVSYKAPTDSSSKGTFTVNEGAPTAKKIGSVTEETTAYVYFNEDGNIEASYSGYNVNDFASAAESGNLATTGNGKTESNAAG